MTRWAGVGIGTAVMAAVVSLAAGTSRARADDEEQRRHVDVFRFGGGAARLGVTLEDVGAADVARLKLGEERGAVVGEVSKGSAAEKAGLKDGDVILSYQGEKVWSAAQLRRLVRETPPGRQVTVEVSRGGAVQRLTARLEESRDRELDLGGDAFRFDVPMPPIPPAAPLPPLDRLLDEESRGRRFLFRDRFAEGHPGRLGLTYQEVSGQLARYFKVEDGALLVTEVEEDGPAARAGLRAGDVIVKLDGKTVNDAADLRRGLDDVEDGRAVTLTVQRDGHPVDLKVTPRAARERRIRTPRSST